MYTIIDIISSRKRKLEHEIKELKNAKFSSLPELNERDSMVAQKTAQLERVQFAQLTSENGGPICPECFISHNIKISTYSTGHGTDEVDVFRCPECKVLIDAPVP